MAQRLKCLPAMQDSWVLSLSREDPRRRKWQPTPVFLPGESHGGRTLVGYSPWGRKESDTTERFHFTSLHGRKGQVETTRTDSTQENSKLKQYHISEGNAKGSATVKDLKRYRSGDSHHF